MTSPGNSARAKTRLLRNAKGRPIATAAATGSSRRAADRRTSGRGNNNNNNNSKKRGAGGRQMNGLNRDGGNGNGASAAVRSANGTYKGKFAR